MWGQVLHLVVGEGGTSSITSRPPDNGGGLSLPLRVDVGVGGARGTRQVLAQGLQGRWGIRRHKSTRGGGSGPSVRSRFDSQCH